MQKKTVYLIGFLIFLAEASISFNSVLLPKIGSYFQASDFTLQATIALSVFALGFAGFIYGGIADGWGRKKLILFGLLLFITGTTLGAFSPTIMVLLISRLFQGAGAGVAWIIGNAVVSDIFTGTIYVAIMNRLHVIASIVPALAPVVGTMVADAYGWQSCYIILIGLGILALFAHLCFLPETLTNYRAVDGKQFVQNYLNVINNRKIMGFWVVKVLAVSMLFVDSANLPIICIDFQNLSSYGYAVFISTAFLGYMFGSLISEKLCKHYDIATIVQGGLRLILACQMFLILGSIVVDSSHFYALLPFKICIYIGFGLIFGNTSAALVKEAGQNAAAASALMISGEMLFSSTGIFIVSLFFDGTLHAISMYGFAVSLISLYVLSVAGEFSPLKTSL